MNRKKFVSLDKVGQGLAKIEGMPELIEEETASLHAAHFVEQARKQAKLSQADLAEKIGECRMFMICCLPGCPGRLFISSGPRTFLSCRPNCPGWKEVMQMETDGSNNPPLIKQQRLSRRAIRSCIAYKDLFGE